jgi:diadenylate cyclase
MHLDRFLTRSRVIDIKSATLEGALGELLAISARRFDDLNESRLLKGLLERESTMTTYLGNSVILPHVRVDMKRRYLFAVGRCCDGIRYDGLKEGDLVRIVFLLIADNGSQDYLQVLSSVARLFKDRDVVDNLVNAPDIDVFYERLSSSFGGLASKPVLGRQNRTSRLILREAEKIAKGSNCSAIALFGDTLTTAPAASSWFPKFKTILVTRNAGEIDFDTKRFSTVIQVRSFSRTRLAQLRSSILIGMTRKIIEFNDRICCVGGVPDSDLFDTIVVVDVQREFKPLLADQDDFLPPDVKPEVFERVIAIATELAVEGREGRPAGSLFVLGDSVRVEKLSKPLVMNPFYGYREEDRNILNPFMDETVKEFSSVDGAFIIRGDGVISSSGSLIYAPDYYHALPSGLGSRHAAAAAISLATQCISIVVSSSTGQVTVFRRGVLLPLFEKGVAG